MNLKKYVGTKAFYRNLFAISFPIVIQNAITNFISMLDNIMVGQIGTEQMSGVSIVNQLLFVFNLCIFGAVSGAGLYGAQFFGNGDHEGIRHTFRFKLLICTAVAVIAVAAFWLAGEPLIRLYLHEGSETGDLGLTLNYAKQYLRVMLIGLIPWGITTVYASTLREIRHTVPPMVAGIAGVSVNLFFNWILIFGKFGFPAMGVVGAAVATVISRFVECAGIIVWTHTHTDRCLFAKGVYRSFRIPAALAGKIAVTGFPLLVNETLWAAGMATLLQCYSIRGIAVVSAMNISNVISNTFSVLYYSLGTSIAIILGHTLGAGDTQRAREDAVRLQAFSILVGIVTGLLIAACSPFFPNLYNTTEEVRSLARSFGLIVAGAAPIVAFANASYFTLRSGGKTLLTFLFDSVYVWGVTVTTAFLLANFTTLDPIRIYVAVSYIDILKCISGAILVKSGIWARNMTSERGENPPGSAPNPPTDSPEASSV